MEPLTWHLSGEQGAGHAIAAGLDDLIEGPRKARNGTPNHGPPLVGVAVFPNRCGTYAAVAGSSPVEPR